MVLTALVYDAFDNRIGVDEIFTINSLSVRENLDLINTFRFTAPAADRRIYDVKAKRRVEIYDDNALVANGYVCDRPFTRSTQQFGYECFDILTELTRMIVGVDRRIDAKSAVETLALFASEAGWSVSVTASDNVVAMFAGVSYYQAMLDICKRFRIHIRRNANQIRHVEMGRFGEDSGVLVENTGQVNPGFENRDDVAILGNLTILETSSVLINRVFAYGAGKGSSRLTLEGASGTPEYQVRSLERGGRTLWYIEDVDSILKYGLHEACPVWSSISLQPPGSDAAQLAAKNQLHSAAVSYLQLHKAPHVAYQFDVERLPDKVKIGDKLWLRYHGDSDRRTLDNPVVKPGDITDVDELLFVTGIEKTWRGKDAGGGIAYRLEVSTLDKPVVSDKVLQVSNLQQSEVYRTLAEPKKQTLRSGIQAVTDQLISAVAPSPLDQPVRAKFEIEFEEDVLILHKALLYIETSLGIATSNQIFINGNPRRETSIPYYLSIFINDYDIGTDMQTIDEISGTSGIDPTTITTEYAGKTIANPPRDSVWGLPDTPQQFRFDIARFLKNEDGSVNRKHTIEVYNAQSATMGTGVFPNPPSEIPSFGTVRFSYIIEVTTTEDAED